jgi:hypothetical protein
MEGRGRGTYEKALKVTAAVLMGGVIFLRHDGDDNDRRTDELIYAH